MVNFEMNVTTEAWQRGLFDCEINSKGRRELNELSRHWMVEDMRFDSAEEAEEYYWSVDEGLDKYNLTHIGSGKTRVVVEAPNKWMSSGGPDDCIIKIQWDEHYHQNHQELTTWEEANSRQAALLNPILDHSGRLAEWLVMPRAETYRDVSTSTVHQIANNLRGRAGDVGMSARDIRAGNVGRVEGRDVIIDYGQVRIR